MQWISGAAVGMAAVDPDACARNGESLDASA
jgi:hypothetical protein